MEPFTALADPTRRRIVEMLATGERAAGDIVDEFDVSPPAISQHLKTLREAGLVQVRAEAQRRIYALDPKGFAALEAWLAQVRRYWGPKLDALERALAAETKPRRRT